MRKTETREIGGMPVKVQQHPPLDALELWHELIAEFGDALITVFEGVAKNVDVKTLAGPLMGAFAKLDRAGTRKYLKQILAYAVADVDGRAYELADFDHLNEAFAGNPAGIYKAAYFALEVNYRDFIAGFASGDSAEPKAGES